MVLERLKLKYFCAAFVMTALVLTLLLLNSSGAGADQEPAVDFRIANPHISQYIDEDGYAEAFYLDDLELYPMIYEPDGDEIKKVEWSFELNETEGLTTTDSRDETFTFVVGEDHLFAEGHSGDPVETEPNSPARDYIITLRAWDENDNLGEHHVDIRIFSLAHMGYYQEVKLGDQISGIEVQLKWRGFPEEAAPTEAHIDDDHPVFVHINETEGLNSSLGERGIVGPAFNITVIGCHLQDGSEGFVEAELMLPSQQERVENLGNIFLLEERIRLEKYHSLDKCFYPVHESYSEQKFGELYATGNIMESGCYVAIVDCVYNQSNPGYEEVLPDLRIRDMELSRNPALEGQVVEIRAAIDNTGILHARDVNLSFYAGDVFLGNRTSEPVLSGGDQVEILYSFEAALTSPGLQHEEQTITAHVNPFNDVPEAAANRENNIGEEILLVMTTVNENVSLTIDKPGNDTTVSNLVTITGTSAFEFCNFSFEAVQIPFYAGYRYSVISVGPNDPSLLPLSYAFFDSQGVAIPGAQGWLADTYGLQIHSEGVNLSYDDNDRDGKFSSGDIFLIKDVAYGGFFQEGYTLNITSLKNPVVEKVELSVDDGPWFPATVDGTGNWSLEWDSATVPEGSHLLRARAYGSNSYSRPVELSLKVIHVVPNVRPTLSISEPADGSTVSGKITIKGTASDEDGSITKVEISLDDATEWLEVTGLDSWTYTLDTKKLANGEYTMLLRCFDGSTYSKISEITVTVENEDDDEPGFLPGFGMAIFACGLLLASWKRRIRKGQTS